MAGESNSIKERLRMKKPFIVKFINLLLFGLLLLTACQTSTGTPSAGVTLSSPAVVENTETPVPTVVSPTETPGTVFFVTNSTENDQLSDYLMEYSSSNDLVFQKNSSLNEIKPRQNDVVVLLENETLQFVETDIQPDVNYVVFTLTDKTLSGNIHQIKQNLGEQVFLAGYISALIADDWRSGAILPNESISGTSYEQIFKNGGHYLCGRCAPVYAPVVFFPVTAAVDSTTAVFDAYSQLESNRIFVLYIPDTLLTSELYTTLRENKRVIISDAPPKQETDQMADLYIYQDFVSPLSEALLNINSPDKSLLTTKLMIQDSANKLSEGKLNFIQEMITNLESGLLSPYTVIEN